MRGLIAFACRAFPRDYRPRQSGELVDTALLAANGSAWGAIGEASSLVVAGVRERLRAESRYSVRDGLVPLAWLLATVNLAIALGGTALGVHPPPYPDIPSMPWSPVSLRSPYVLDWWWIVFAVAAAAIVLGLAVGSRRIASSAAFANVGILVYDALGNHSHMEAFVPPLRLGGPAFPSGWQWLTAGVVLALATAGAPSGRRSLRRLPLAVAAALLLIVVSRETSGNFFFLCWALAAVVALAIAFGWVVPRLAVLAVGLTLVVVPIPVADLTTPYDHAPLVTWLVLAGLLISVALPLAQLTRRRLT